MSQPDIHRYFRHGTLPQLRLFEASARLGSFTRAAQELHMAQPTASVQIKKLSETVGVPLFEQVGKRLYLTEAGRRLYESCQEVFRVFTTLEESLAEHARAGIGSAAACGEHDGHVLRPAAPRRVRRAPSRRRDLDASPQPADADRAARRATRTISISSPTRRRWRTSSRRSSCPIRSSCSHATTIRSRENATSRSSVSREEPFLIREEGSGARRIAMRLFAEHGLARRIRMELGTNEAIKEAILAGLGVTIMSRYTFGLDPESSRYRVPRRRGLSPSRTTGISRIPRASSSRRWRGLSSISRGWRP